MKIGKWMAAVAVAGFAGGANAAVSMTGLTYSENFDSTLQSTNQTGAFSATSGTQAAIPGTSGWDGVKVSGTGTSNMNYTVDDGISNSGAIYNYRTPSSTDFSLGSLASGTNVPAFGVELINNSTIPWTSITVTFDREQYRSSTTTQNVLAFFWGVSGGTITSSNYLTSGDMTALTALNAVGELPVTTNGKLDPPSIVTDISSTITFASPLAVGESVFLRWTDTNDSGNDAGLAVDNVRVTAIPEPGTLALAGLGLLAMIQRRRTA